MTAKSMPAVFLDFKPAHKFFIGIDSDGCVFDTMEIKQKECFCPCFIKYYELQAVSKYAREVWEFVNLYSKWRGANRFLALIKALELLAERPEVLARVNSLPDPAPLRDWTSRETKLSNGPLEAYQQANPHDELARAIAYSHAINRAVEDLVRGVGPFPLVRAVLEKARSLADMVVVSQTPTEALVREWQEHALDHFPAIIAGQELGSKGEHLEMCAGPHYPPQNILMIGDAPGDYKAANKVKALFFPIIPGAEEASWKRLHDEALDRFFAGTYHGAYEQALIEAFNRSLPERPPWSA